MKYNLEETLTRVAEETFVSMAFMLPVEDEAACENREESRACACITFSGPFSGSLFLSVPENALPVLAANIVGLGADGPITPEEQLDAMKEVLNVICGNLLPKISTPKEVFDVHQPRILSGDEVAEISEIYGNDDPEAMASLWLDCGRIALAMWLDRPAAVVKA